jgi:hypothetical protein
MANDYTDLDLSLGEQGTAAKPAVVIAAEEKRREKPSAPARSWRPEFMENLPGGGWLIGGVLLIVAIFAGAAWKLHQARQVGESEARIQEQVQKLMAKPVLAPAPSAQPASVPPAPAPAPVPVTPTPQATPAAPPAAALQPAPTLAPAAPKRVAKQPPADGEVIVSNGDKTKATDLKSLNRKLDQLSREIGLTK